MDEPPSLRTQQSIRRPAFNSKSVDAAAPVARGRRIQRREPKTPADAIIKWFPTGGVGIRLCRLRRPQPIEAEAVTPVGEAVDATEHRCYGTKACAPQS